MGGPLQHLEYGLRFALQLFPVRHGEAPHPEVSDYQDKPNEYIYDRALALYAHLHFSLFGRSEGGTNVDSFNWATDELTDHFGEVNRASANDYDAKVNELAIADATHGRWI